jgi:hypothetical protein
MSNLHNIEQEERITDEVYTDNSPETQLLVKGLMATFGYDRDMALMKIAEQRVEEWRKAHD